MDKFDFRKAKQNKKDEFYTQLSDIENELKNYKSHFKGKTVFCNCDDPEWSNFTLYFAQNFEHLELKRLISTGYDQDGTAIVLDLSEDLNGDGKIDHKDLFDAARMLYSDGDFRSEESIELLKQADIVVTNPPFSLFREYISQLMEYNKKFLIIGNMNAVGCKEIFPLVKENKIWLGVTGFNKGMYFRVPDDFEYSPSYKFEKEINGEKVGRVSGISWFTNMEHHRRNEDVLLYKKYTIEEYPKYDNFDAIEVGIYTDIPCDYDGVMGVPITFVDKYNPSQFQIVGFRKGDDGKDLSVDGKSKYLRILIKKK